jgi:tRNA (guanine-N7-)-methyltransferase
MEKFLNSNIKSFVVRNNRLTKGQKKAIIDFSSMYCLTPESCPIGFKNVFRDDKPIVIDIGFGMGQEMINYASTHHEINILGIEVYKPAIGSVLREINTKELKNLRLVVGDALTVVKDFVPSNSIKEFHIYFPDPWPKKRHYKRRLIDNEFSKILIDKLNHGGFLRSATDNSDYAHQILSCFTSQKLLTNTANGFAERPIDRHCSKFEKKALQKNSSIYEICFKKS